MLCVTKIPPVFLLLDKQFYESRASVADQVNQILQLEDNEISALSQ